MMAYCGTYCETCDWKERMNCNGCKLEQGHPFWGSCSVALCAIGHSYDHCGQCKQIPCEGLSAAFNNPEHGDTGERLTNLLCWKVGKESMLKVRPQKE